MTLDPAAVAALPKVALHDHLDGGMRVETILELATAQHLPLPAGDAAGLAAWIHSHRGSLARYLEPFSIITPLLQTPDALHRVAREHVATLAADGVVLAEVRWAPSFHLASGMSRRDALDAVTAGLRDGIADQARAGQAIHIGQLLCIMRGHGDGDAIADLAIEERGTANAAVVGVDMAGEERAGLAADNQAAFDRLAAELLPVTVHAGEAAGLDSILDALVEARALRLGHGVRVAEDIARDAEGGARLGHIAGWVRDRQIALETSPTSNVDTGAIAPWGTSLANHPFALLDSLGFAVTVNPDARLLSGTSVSGDVVALSEAFGYGLDDVAGWQLTAARASFLPFEVRESAARRIAAQRSTP